MGWIRFRHGGVWRRLAVARAGPGVWIGWPGRARHFVPERGQGGAGPVRPEEVRAPMTGKVVQVAVAPGSRVEQNQVLVVLEAMKMEYRLAAPRDGVVEAVHCKVGDLVDLGRLLVTFARAPEGAP